MFGLSVVKTKTLARLHDEAAAGVQLSINVEALIEQARRDGGCNFIDKLEGLHDTYQTMKNGGNNGK